MDPFKLLTNGAKFNVKKFEIDLSKFKKAKFEKNHLISNSNNSKKSVKSDVSSNFEESRKKFEVFVDGKICERLINSFDDLNMPKYLRKNLTKSGYHRPTSVQMQVIPLMLDQKQIIACAPTGSGKTLSFLLPILIQLKNSKSFGFRAIILCPTRELAKQTHRECLWISLGSGLRIYLIKNVNFAMKKFHLNSAFKYDILITTPKRLEYLLKQVPPCLNVQNLEWLIVDECDRLFESTFRPQLASIFNMCSRSMKLKLAMFSATYDPHLHEWCSLNLNDIVAVFIGHLNKASFNIEQKFVLTGTEAGKLYALREIIREGCLTPVLVFVASIRKANFLEKELSSMNLKVKAMHSKLSQEHRDQTVRSFREGETLFLICTELMARGIDFKACQLVINYDLPSSWYNYIHHIGRTGRANRKGFAVTFYTFNEMKKIQYFQQTIDLDAFDSEKVHKNKTINN